MDKIYEILNDLRPEFDFKESKSFVEVGLLDSFDIVTLVSEIEEKFDIMIDALDIVPEKFESVDAIAELIKKNGGRI